MRLPQHWLISAICGPAALLASTAALTWSPWAGALVLAAPALPLGSVGVSVVASYLVGVLAGAALLVGGGLPNDGAVEHLELALIGWAALVCLGVTLLSQLVLRERLRRWSAAMVTGLVCAGGALLFAMFDGGAALRAELGATPEILVSVPPCSPACLPSLTPGGHLHCSQIVQNDRVVATRECDAAAAFLRVSAGDLETSVLMARDERAVVWREETGRLVVEQEGTLVRALSEDGAVLLSASFSSRSPQLSGVSLQVAGASLLMVGVALSLVLRSLRTQRLLADGLVGHVEAGRFFPRDGHLTPMALSTAYANGPALLFGDVRRASYRDGGAGRVRVVSGTPRELALRHAERRVHAYAFALCTLLFAWLGVAADLARLH